MQSHRSTLPFHLKRQKIIWPTNLFYLKYLLWRSLYLQNMRRRAWKISDLRFSFWYVLCTTPFGISMRFNSGDLILAGFQNTIEIWYLNWDAILIWLELLALWLNSFSWSISLWRNNWMTAVVDDSSPFNFRASGLNAILIHTNIFVFRWHHFLSFKTVHKVIRCDLHRNYFHMLERSQHPCFL